METRLIAGFEYVGTRVPFLGPQGIFKPRIMDLPLSITTAPYGPYDDTFNANGLLEYRYRGQDPIHRDNVGLRTLMQKGLPLIYFHGVAKGRYVPAWPVFVTDDAPDALTFTVSVDDAYAAAQPEFWAIRDDGTDLRRQYRTAAVKVRLHQRTFRERVLIAYRRSCAICRLKHEALLDAAHILPDSMSGEPTVRNGLALCKLHHAAFDQNLLGIRPDFVAEIRLDVLEETDGPMLKHGLQEMHGQKLLVPRRSLDQPSREALEARYEEFRAP